MTDATAALEIDPNNAEVASLLAAIYEQRGNLDEAAVWYRIALELGPNYTVTSQKGYIIQQRTASTGAYRYVMGASGYAAAWVGRAGLAYTYFNLL